MEKRNPHLKSVRIQKNLFSTYLQLIVPRPSGELKDAGILFAIGFQLKKGLEGGKPFWKSSALALGSA